MEFQFHSPDFCFDFDLDVATLGDCRLATGNFKEQLRAENNQNCVGWLWPRILECNRIALSFVLLRFVFDTFLSLSASLE